MIDARYARRGRRPHTDRAHAPAYPGVVAASRAGWLLDAATAASYRRALIEANRWATEPANEDAAVAALTANRYSADAAHRLVSTAVHELAVSRDGWRETIALRRDAGLLAEPEPRFEDVVLPALDR